MEQVAIDVWDALGREIVTFGWRWLIVAVPVLLGGGFLGKRYWTLRREVENLQKEPKGTPALPERTDADRFASMVEPLSGQISRLSKATTILGNAERLMSSRLTEPAEWHAPLSSVVRDLSGLGVRNAPDMPRTYEDLLRWEVYIFHIRGYAMKFDLEGAREWSGLPDEADGGKP